MKNVARFFAVVSLAAVCSAALAQTPNMVHAHIGHVADSFKDTPKQQGFLPTAAAEAQIAATHAGLAMKMTSDLDAMKLHAGHVLHAIDPTLVDKGPGLGYGVKKATASTAAHLEMAAKLESASANVKTHTGHIVGFTTNTTKGADAVVDLAQRIRGAKTAAEAAPLVTQMNTAAAALVTELKQAQDHMALMKKGEGLK